MCHFHWGWLHTTTSLSAITTTASVNYSQTADNLPFCTRSTGPVSFLADAVVHGADTSRGSGSECPCSAPRSTRGTPPPRVLRLTKAQLNGVCEDGRFDDGFFLDLIFEACNEASAAAALAASGAVGIDDNLKGAGATGVTSKAA